MEVRSNKKGIIALLLITSLVLGISGFLLLVNSGDEPSISTDGLEMAQSTNASGAEMETQTTIGVLPTKELTTDGILSGETSEKIKLTARVGLQGTDPEIVNLASGDIQLVEFFAFW